GGGARLRGDAVGGRRGAAHGRGLRAGARGRAVRGRVPVAVLALALVVAGLAARFAVRTLQTARHGDARDFAILYTAAHLFRLGAVAALTLAAIFLTWEPLENSMGLGQINQLVLALLALFVWALASGRAALGGAALGVATALRVHPALFIGWLAWRGKWLAFG